MEVLQDQAGGNFPSAGLFFIFGIFFSKRLL
jgi:hypothetical protein